MILINYLICLIIPKQANQKIFLHMYGSIIYVQKTTPSQSKMTFQDSMEVSSNIPNDFNYILFVTYVSLIVPKSDIDSLTMNIVKLIS